MPRRYPENYNVASDRGETGVWYYDYIWMNGGVWADSSR